MRVKLSDLTKYSKGVQINGDNLIDDGKYIYLNGGINPSGRWNEANVDCNTITISEGGNSSGYVNYLTEPFWCGAHCYYLYDGPKNTKYLYYALKSQQKRLFRIRSGACMPNIKKADLGKFEFEYNSDENKQEEVVSVLSMVESFLNDRKRELVLLDTLIKARFVEMFGDMILNPNGWNVFRLGDLCDVRDGTHDSPKYYQRGYPLVTSKNVTNGQIDFSDCNLICEEDYKKINKRSKVDLGDIIMPMIGTVGNPVIVDINAEFAIKNVALIKFKKESLVLNSFIRVLLESDYFDRAVIDTVRGGTQKFISLGDIRNLKICLPPIEKQKYFSLFVQQVDKSKFVVQQALNKTQLLFDSLMQKYFG